VKYSLFHVEEVPSDSTESDYEFEEDNVLLDIGVDGESLGLSF
jgi:hypothetical protein